MCVVVFVRFVFDCVRASALVTCDAICSFNFSASIEKPINLGVPSALLTLSSISNSSIGPVWAANSFSKYTVQLVEGIPKYGVTDMGFQSSFEALLNANLFGVKFNAQASTSLNL